MGLGHFFNNRSLGIASPKIASYLIKTSYLHGAVATDVYFKFCLKDEKLRKKRPGMAHLKKPDSSGVSVLNKLQRKVNILFSLL